jgi:regulator of sigma E protease
LLSTIASIFSTHGLLVGTIVPFLFVLTAVVFVHEMGHYLVGRWCGIGVSAFSIGFGPELVGFNDRRGTRWKLCAIPLGGYVKFVGDMNAVSQPDAQATAELSEDERKVAFHTQAIWKRAATVFAGPLFNFLLTISVLAILFSIYGKVVIQPTVAEVVAGSPAAAAGFLPGDRFVSVDGQPVESFADVQRLVSGRSGDTIIFVMLRDGKEVVLTAVPQISEQKDALGNTVKVGIIGVVTNEQVGQPRYVSFTPGGALLEAVRETGHIVERTGQFMQRFVAGRARLPVAGAIGRTAVRRHRNPQSAADSAARWRAPAVLRHRGRNPPSRFGARDGNRLSYRLHDGSPLYGIRVLERPVWLLKL